jgi:hypothetical protein
MKNGCSSKKSIIRGIFVTEGGETPFQKLFLRITQAGTASRNFLPGIDVTNSLPSPTEGYYASGTGVAQSV